MFEEFRRGTARELAAELGRRRRRARRVHDRRRAARRLAEPRRETDGRHRRAARPARARAARAGRDRRRRSRKALGELPGHEPQAGVRARARDRGARDDADTGRRQGPHRVMAAAELAALRDAYRELRGRRRYRRRALRVSPRVGATGLAGDRPRRARRAAWARSRTGRRASRRAAAARISCCCAPRSRRCPAELEQIADEVDVLLPWGALLEGIVRARAEIVGGIAALARPGRGRAT